MIKIEIQDVNCDCVANNASTRVVYMIYPQVEGFSEEWLNAQAQTNGCSIVMVYVPGGKWNAYMTPWPEPGETPKSPPFAGDASEFLNMLESEIIPRAEQAMGLAGVAERDLAGVSLAGLFTLWQWMQRDSFRSIACLSGSFWYSGYMDWLGRQAIPPKRGKAFFLLGTDEPKAYIRAYRSVGLNTQATVDALKKAGIDTTFAWLPGNHFSDPMQRAEMALKGLCR